MSEQTLQQPHFTPFPLGAVKPSGWLKNQLRIQADGLSGHLDEFWPDIKDSAWFGGSAEGWERAPYWLDGFIPLAYLLDDPHLKAKAQRYVEYILDHQHDDGWLGPKPEDIRYQDIWSLFLGLKMLIQYHDVTGDQRIVTAVEKCLCRIDLHIDNPTLFCWAQFRWFEALIPLYWLYEKTGEPWLLDLATKLCSQGFDWKTFFAHWPGTQPTPKGRWNFMGHVVNNAMAIKAHGLWWRQSAKEEDRAAVYDMIDKLDRYHGMVTGVFTGDECLAGMSPIQGTELCAVAEYMYSLEILLSIMGDPAFADRLEKIAFNALPATFSPDMWTHQYDQQVNQVECSINANRPWNTNGPDSNLFGLEPNYGCCTANLGQAWPKFAAHLWMQYQDEGLVAVAYAPSVVTTIIDNARVEARIDTEYPFRESVRITITSDKIVRFPLLLRIPQWADGATLQIANDAPEHPQSGEYYHILREWQKGTTEITLHFPMQPFVIQRPRNTIAIQRGPLVYALKIGEEWKRVNADQPYREFPHADYEIYATTPWNYALNIGEKTMSESLVFTEHSVGDRPFSPDGAPMSCTVKGQRLPEWQRENGSAQEVPESSVSSTESEEELTLIPYGCTNLRITEFPVLV